MPLSETQKNFLSGVVLGFFIAVLLMWLFWWPERTFYLDRPVILNSNQKIQLAQIRNSLQTEIENILMIICMNKDQIISELRAIPETAMISCEVMKAQLVKKIMQMAENSPPNLRDSLIKSIVQLWVDYAISRYCTASYTNYTLMKEHAVRAVKDLCRTKSDVRNILLNMSEYVILKPLSIMS